MKAESKFLLCVFLSVLIAGNALVIRGQSIKSAPIRAGAAKVDITPAAGELPATWEGIHDRIYSRAVVIDNGVTSAALITVDIGMMSDKIWTSLTARAEKELGIPAVNVMLTATHT
ncbi:hypothetical protein EG830_03195, partial [bacterium]|nr:hypothetical protein [bacterium]